VPRALHAVSGDGLVAGRAVCLTPVTLLDPADWAWPDDGDHEGPLCWVTSSSRTGRRAFEPRIGFITSSPGRSPPFRCCRLRWRGGARACGGRRSGVAGRHRDRRLPAYVDGSRAAIDAVLAASALDAFAVTSSNPLDRGYS
jgi:hypothetical protein